MYTNPRRPDKREKTLKRVKKTLARTYTPLKQGVNESHDEHAWGPIVKAAC